MHFYDWNAILPVRLFDAFTANLLREWTVTQARRSENAMARFNAMKAIEYPVSCKAPFQRLPELAYNLWWAWHPEAQNLFDDIDPEHWHRHHNPVKLLRECRKNLEALGKQAPFVARYRALMKNFDADLDTAGHWHAKKYPQQRTALVAYFSPEFGLHESLPIYSGGLGVLAGDHVKTASDLGLPLVGVGLLYKHGYFIQRVDAQGRQHAIYPHLNFDELPVLPLHDRKGGRLIVPLELAERTVYAQAWLVSVGSASLILLDTDIPSNRRQDRQLTGQLYGGDREMRLAQEIIMGMGGVRVLRALGLEPAVWHLNEGHVAFLCFERIRELLQEERLSFEHALEAVAANTVFTTHTPVPAGNETFALPLMHKYFRNFCGDLKIDLAALLDLGLQTEPSGWKYFSMTVLALRLSRANNGVSKLHGQVSREMWRHLWPGVPANEIPITSITNGVHADTWMAPHFADIYGEYLGQHWRAQLAHPSFWDKARMIPNEVVWQARFEAKSRLIAFVRTRLVEQYRRQGAATAKIKAAQNALAPEVLTIGFARRFAAYKRADLIFHDLARLEKIIHHAQRPVQFIFAGKAHPRDEAGQLILQRVFRMTQRKNLFGKVVFLEDYDMNAGRMLVQGVDVWLNNPRRPMEASGTSGQKVPFNAGLNFSILDGWWEEGYNGKNGWKFGQQKQYENEARQDAEDAADLYRVLENEVAPLYYHRDHQGMPQRWLQRVKESMATLTPQFNTNTMVQAYSNEFYAPARRRAERLMRRDYSTAKLAMLYKQFLRLHWPVLHFATVERKGRTAGRTVIGARVYLGELDPSWLQVECVSETKHANGFVLPLRLVKAQADGIYEYHLTLTQGAPKPHGLRLRLIPRAALFEQAHEAGMVIWSETI